MSLAIPHPKIAQAAPSPRYLGGGPLSDFMMLGGSTLVLFPLMLLLPEDSLESRLATAAFWLQVLINWPHFAVSYRIFYEGFADKVTGVGQSDTTLKYRYIFAGVIAPAVLIGLTLIALQSDTSRMLTYGFNVMGFFVGWHYIKQGYGMAMVDAALKKRFMSAFDKKVLLVNGYAAWAYAWTSGNRDAEPFSFYAQTVNRLDVPDVVMWAMTAFLVASSCMTGFVLLRRFRTGTPTAWIGVVAYLVSVYVWMFIVRANPLLALFVPALHSLQYLWVVRRFQLNRHAAEATDRGWLGQYLISAVLGFGMFMAFPLVFNVFIEPDVAAFGTVPFTFIFIVFINVHHYFLDNVMWRRGNAAVSQHLFS